MRKIFDAHCHIIDKRFPLIENNGYLPSEFGVKDYLTCAKPLGVHGGAIVSGSFQAFDQSYLIDALKLLNTNGQKFVGVTQVSVGISDEALSDLNGAGVRAVRFNAYRGGSESLEKLEYIAKRVFDLFGWHVELYIGHEALRSYSSTIASLPAVSIDHLGMDKEANKLVLSLVEKGVRVKATGFGRIGFEPIEFMKKVNAINPEALMFGSDLPSTRAIRAFSEEDLILIEDNFSDEDVSNICLKNSLSFYRIAAL